MHICADEVLALMMALPFVRLWYLWLKGKFDGSTWGIVLGRIRIWWTGSRNRERSHQANGEDCSTCGGDHSGRQAEPGAGIQGQREAE